MTIETRIIYNNFEAIARKLPQAVSRHVRETCLGIQADIAVGMSGPHSGAIYGDHQASAPGEMPAIDSGHLAASIQVEAEPNSTVGYVYTDVEYAPFLEAGAPNAGIEPRPFMAPATEGRAGEFIDSLRRLEDDLR